LIGGGIWFSEKKCTGKILRTKSLQPVFAKDLYDHGKKEASFWYDFKFVNPATKKIQVKDQFCESLNQTVVCAGVYRP
jgi:hypothetical protein